MSELTGCVGGFARPALFTKLSPLTMVLLASMAAGGRAAGQAADIPRYAARIKVLIEAHEQLVENHQRILHRKRELQTEFVEAQAAVERLQVRAAVNKLKAQQAAFIIPEARDDLRQWFETGDIRFSDGGDKFFGRSLSRAKRLEQWAQELEFSSQRIDSAGRATIDHMRACVEQALALQKEAVELESRYDKLQEDFGPHADIVGQRCREELAAAMNELGSVGNNNPAGLIVRGVALRRLHRFSDAQADFDRVIQSGGRWQPVALAARGELLVAQGESRAGFSDLHRAVSSAKSDPRVLYLHAQGLATVGKYRYAERAWKRLLAVGGYDAFVHRNLAFLYSASGDMWRRPEVALEHAEIACDRTDMSEWSCLLAFSTTKAANEEFDLAIEWAESAAEMALGDKRELCLDFIEQYQAREQPTWDWKQ